ncbi:MAG TPA: hypothetical protein PLB91_06440 [Spirochaetales bacterium]|nr:hypothetical protein [Spirochaetales bacterium]HRY56458.1 hypothetical protein [Spirochaetia bacterium]HRZ64171.1 hypothetical protein [Spirochaetia bacterium]
MKKALVLLSVFIAALALPLFANDALVMPKGVFRTYITAAYASGDQAFDDDGEKQDKGVTIKALNLGTALEFGINEWITGGIQWAPGYNVSSSYEPDGYPSAAPAMDINGAFDVKVGAKVQIVGPEAPVQNDQIRFAVTPGVKIPLGGADFEEEATNYIKGDDITVSDPAKHAFAVGAQVAADYVVNEMFYLNVYCEFMKYFEKKDVYTSAMTVASPGKVDVAYGYDLTLELEPHFGMPLGPGQFGASLPVTYEKSPETEYNGTGNDLDSYTLSIGPNVSYLFKAGPIPLETKLGYTLPLAGKNADILPTAVFQLKVYFQF